MLSVGRLKASCKNVVERSGRRVIKMRGFFELADSSNPEVGWRNCQIGHSNCLTSAGWRAYFFNRQLELLTPLGFAD